jgi:DNA-binding transcriptional ArsR family regulator
VTETHEDRADALFHALADRTRRDIMRRVLAGEHSVSALAAGYDMSFAAVQKHVSVLEKAGLLTKRRRGREQLARGDVEAVRSVASLLTELEQVWRGRVARIDDLLAADPDRPAPDRPAPDRPAPDRPAPERPAPDRATPDDPTPTRRTEPCP